MVTSSCNDLPADGLVHRIELVPNCSLSPQSARRFVASVAALTLGIATFFAAQGLWPILPFAGLEVALLAWAVQRSLLAGRQRDTIVISADRVVVEQLRLRRSRRLVFARHWAAVKLRDPLAACSPSRLTIESQGRGCEVGRFLTEAERLGVAGELRALVGRMSESPALGVRSDALP